MHVLQWPGDKLTLPALPAKIVRATLLSGEKVKYSQAVDGISLTLPATARDTIDTVIAVQIDSPASQIAPLKI